jgi:vacuolar protein sorting-associated protein VTA1
MRIIKAIKAGEDPNLTTDLEEEPESALPPLDPNDPEVKKIKSLQPTVEDYPEDKPSPMQEDEPPQFVDEAPQTRSYSAQPSVPSFPQSNDTGGDVSPLEPEPSNEEYFPQIPKFNASTSPNLPTAATGDPMQTSPTLHSRSPISPQNFYQPQAPPVNQVPYIPPKLPPQPPVVQNWVPMPQPSVRTPIAVSQFTQQAPETYNDDDEAILQAQRHTKFAISALNFDDVPTAVKELRHALEVLGAR